MYVCMVSPFPGPDMMMMIVDGTYCISIINWANASALLWLRFEVSTRQFGFQCLVGHTLFSIRIQVGKELHGGMNVQVSVEQRVEESRRFLSEVGVTLAHQLLVSFGGVRVQFFDLLPDAVNVDQIV